MTTGPKPWVLYVRVSTEDQASAGISLDAQLTACRAYAVAKGWTVAEEISDPGASAATLQRPGMTKVLAALKAGSVAGVIAWRLDRLTRSLRDLLSLVDLTADNRVGLVSVTESLDTTTPMGRFVVHLLGAIAQWERETIGQRTKAAISHAKGKGYYTGGSVPAGCAVEVVDGHRRRLVPGEGAEVLRQVWGWILGGDSLMVVARKLRAAGVPSGRRQGAAAGKGWTPSNVRALLLSRMVAGVLTDVETQAMVRATLAKRLTPARSGEVVQGSTRAATTSPLAGILRCPTCDAAMLQVSARGNGGTYRYFRCTQRPKGNCRQKDIKAEPIELEVAQAVAKACQEGGDYHRLIRQGLVAAQAAADGLRAERGQLTGERDQMSARIAQLVLKQQISSPGWDEAMRVVGAELERIDRRLAEISGGLSAAGVDADSLDFVLSELAAGAARLPELPADQQRTFLSRTVGAVRVLAERVVIDLWEPATPAAGGVVRSQPEKWGPWRHGKRTVRVDVNRADKADLRRSRI